MCAGAAQATAAIAAIRLTLAQIVRTHGDAYRRTHRLATVQIRALRAIAACRTALLGGRRVGLIRFGGRISYAACAARRSNAAGLIWPNVECRRRWL